MAFNLLGLFEKQICPHQTKSPLFTKVPLSDDKNLQTGTSKRNLKQLLLDYLLIVQFFTQTNFIHRRTKSPCSSLFILLLARSSITKLEPDVLKSTISGLFRYSRYADNVNGIMTKFNEGILTTQFLDELGSNNRLTFSNRTSSETPRLFSPRA